LDENKDYVIKEELIFVSSGFKKRTLTACGLDKFLSEFKHRFYFCPHITTSLLKACKERFTREGI
jgi:hypothetical protein